MSDSCFHSGLRGSSRRPFSMPPGSSAAAAVVAATAVVTAAATAVVVAATAAAASAAAEEDDDEDNDPQAAIAAAAPVIAASHTKYLRNKEFDVRRLPVTLHPMSAGEKGAFPEPGRGEENAGNLSHSGGSQTILEP